MIPFLQRSPQAEFEKQILPHLDSAYSLARFLVRNDHDAEDIVQEAALRAFRFFDGFRGQNARAWLMAFKQGFQRTEPAVVPPDAGIMALLEEADRRLSSASIVSEKDPDEPAGR